MSGVPDYNHTGEEVFRQRAMLIKQLSCNPWGDTNELYSEGSSWNETPQPSLAQQWVSGSKTKGEGMKSAVRDQETGALWPTSLDSHTWESHLASAYVNKLSCIRNHSPSYTGGTLSGWVKTYTMPRFTCICVSVLSKYSCTLVTTFVSWGATQTTKHSIAGVLLLHRFMDRRFIPAVQPKLWSFSSPVKSRIFLSSLFKRLSLAHLKASISQYCGALGWLLSKIQWGRLITSTMLPWWSV